VAAAPGSARPAGLVLSVDDPAGLAARAVVRFHLRAFAREERQARAGEVEPIHQLRVATRRLRGALRLFAPVLPARFVESARREVAWLADAIGAVRDLDVLGELVRERATRLDPDLRAALGPLAVAIHERRVDAHTALVEVLDSPRCRRLMDRLAVFADAEPATRRRERLGERAGELIRPVVRAVRRAGQDQGEAAKPEALHRLRVRVKRLRYALETLRGLGGKSVGRMIRRLERLQDLLGRHQDAATAIAWLRARAEVGDLPPATLLATGALIHALSRRARRLRRRFPGAWEELQRRKLFDGVLAELGRSARRHETVRRLRDTGT
jgi:CHAD domain-containing protein